MSVRKAAEQSGRIEDAETWFNGQEALLVPDRIMIIAQCDDLRPVFRMMELYAKYVESYNRRKA